MNGWPVRLPGFALLGLLWLALAAGCNKDSAADDVAGSLADRLSAAMNFEQGTRTAGGPPPYFDSPDYPQIEFVSPPEVEIVFGEAFELSVKADYAFPERVSGAMVWVKDAGSHFRITAPLDADSLLMTLRGWIAEDAALRGKTFDVYVSLFRGQETGLHESWRITVPR